MVLTLSLHHENGGRMLWLDGRTTSVEKDEHMPGVSRGPCAFESGGDKELKADNEKTPIKVSFNNLRYGDIYSTYASTADIMRKDAVVTTDTEDFKADPTARPLIMSSGPMILGASVVAFGVGLLVASYRRRAAIADEEVGAGSVVE